MSSAADSNDDDARLDPPPVTAAAERPFHSAFEDNEGIRVRPHGEALLRQPVDLKIAELRDVEERLRMAASFAGPVFGVDPFVLWRIGYGAAALLREGRLGTGLQLTALTDAASIGRGHLDEHFSIEFVCAVDLAVRALAVLEGESVCCQQLYGTAVQAHKDSKAYGVDKHAQTGASLRLLGMAAGSGDRHLATTDVVLTTGTKYDWSSDRAASAEIRRATRELGVAPPGPVDEHVEFLMAIEQTVKRAAARAARERPKLFGDHLGLDATAFYRKAFTKLLVAGAIPVDPPTMRGRLSARIVHLGSTPEVLRVLQGAGRVGVALVDPAQHVPADLARAGWTQRHPRRTVVHDRLHLSPHPEWGVEWWVNQRVGRVVRKGAVGTQAIVTRQWQGFGIDASPGFDEWLDAATALIERYEQPLPEACLGAADRDMSPGKVYARSAGQQACARAALRLGRAALVAGDRRMRRAVGAA
ncbi:MAG TPA: hypothetical protein VFY45_26675 [Baekduia sp.]|nr:hypothetical protein [Baekduia sp.]